MLFLKHNTVCFTGHRPNKLGGYNENNPIMLRVKKQLETKIDEAIRQGYINFITGMALGVDQVAAEIIIRKKETNPELCLIAAIPFEEQYIKWTPKYIERWKRILDSCDDRIVLYGTGYSPYKMIKRNEWMVDHSSMVIAVWNGEESGGTFSCVKYALMADHSPTVVVIDPKRED